MSVQPSDDLAQVLARAGIAPTGDAYAVLYELNPGISGEQRTETLILRVPTVRSRDAKSLAVLTMCGSKKAAFHATVKSISSLAETVDALPAERFASDDVKNRLRETVAQVARLYSSVSRAIRSGNHALSASFIEHLLLESVAFDRHVSGLIRRTSAISANDLIPVANILEDAQAQSSCCNEVMGVFDAPKSSDVSLEVHVTRQGIGVPGLKIVARPEFFKDDPSKQKKFLTTSSPSSGNLHPASWLVWGIDPATEKRVTDMQLVSVTRGREPIKVDLVFIGAQ